MFMDVHHTFVFVNQEFNYSSLLETGVCNRRHFKNSLQLRNLLECSKLNTREGETSDVKPSKLHFLSLLMAEKNNGGKPF
jgi:hypothetical protein